MQWIYRVLWLLSSGLLMAENVPYSGHVSINYERAYLPQNEPMGLLKVGALFDWNDYLYLGGDLFSAVSGRRGGFFTVGIEGGVHIPLSSRLQLKGGLYLGAGGGGAAPQGGGLMVRPYAGIAYDASIGTIEMGVSRIAYPNGDIDSKQIYVGVSVPFGGRYWSGHDFGHRASSRTQHETTDVRATVLLEHYRPSAHAHNAHSSQATQPYSLAGIEFVIGSSPVYGYLQAAGAGAGSSTGYMEVFGGMGYRYRTADRFSFGMQGAVGAGGGGRVDTGGGLMVRGDAVADVSMLDHLHFGVRYGLVGSVAGSFRATSYGATLGYEEHFYGLGDLAFSDDDTALSAWRFRLQNKSYLPAKGMFKNGRVHRVELMGFSLDRFITKNIYLIGESFWAWKGKAGGYAEGVFGLGYQSNTYHGLRLYAEALAGVGGGGGVHMDGGMFGSLGGGIVYDVNRNTQLRVGAARVRSRTGGFQTSSIDVGIHYKFSLMEAP